MMRLRVRSLTWCIPRSARETVAGDTPAFFAISTIPDTICKEYAKNCKTQGEEFLINGAEWR